MQESSALPPGQVEVDDFPRFGLLNFAFRFPAETERIEIAVDGDVDRPARFGEELESLERVEQVSDFHCTTTWTRRGPRFLMNPPRARVMYEERGRVFPPWVFRTLWPAMIPPVRRVFAAGLRRHQQRGSSAASGEAPR